MTTAVSRSAALICSISRPLGQLGTAVAGRGQVALALDAAFSADVAELRDSTPGTCRGVPGGWKLRRRLGSTRYRVLPYDSLGLGPSPPFSRRRASTTQPQVVPMYPNAHQALDSIDRFIGVAEIANLPILAMPEYRAAADDLYQIAQKLLVANENMSRWLNRFLYFDFRAPDARGRFLDLVQNYQTTKAGPGFRDMKFSCGDISIIYQRNIAGKIVEMFPQDEQAVEEARRVFIDLGNADQDMVAFIYDTVVGHIDKFISDAEHDVDRSDLNSAEARRLQFKVATAKLSERLERLAGGLSDLVLQYARLAKRPVTLA